MRYAQIDTEGRVIGVSTLAGAVNAPHMVPIPDSQDEMALIEMRWSGEAFVPAGSSKPRLRVTANQTQIWESTPGLQPDSTQMAMLTGHLLDAQGDPDPTATLPATTILLPLSQPGASPALVLVRATAGVLEINTRQGWSPALPFATEHSGRYDIAVLLKDYFDMVEAPVIEVLRG